MGCGLRVGLAVQSVREEPLNRDRPDLKSEGASMAKFETVPIGDIKHRLPAKLLALVEEGR
jgi:hypothetical protein